MAPMRESNEKSTTDTKACLTFAERRFDDRFWEIFCGLMTQKLNFLVSFFSFFPSVKATQHSTNMVVAEWSCVAGFRENPEGEHPFITSWPEAQEHLDCATRQRSKKIGKSNSEWLKNTKQKAKWVKIQTEFLWHDLKHADDASQPSNVSELKQLWEEEWVKIPPQRKIHCQSSQKAWLQFTTSY